ncbi:hypothetical protein MAAFP003_2379 [Mycobacterium ahvazicum]|uniref:Uncharacterized protein n=1 Tax=Mycobacterium ahvazicum TaxID=1964395 RepID=A0A2K4YA86_9MYCO|nr:hypothetical protein [Mycobacterium ahvazicum]SOX53705.1 hypothetical protein MAAFP003_2379 [Mycobacterium ahvazicum]
MTDLPPEDDYSLFAYLEVTIGEDPGDLGEDEPEPRPLCANCVRDLPESGSPLCAFCRVIQP